MTCDALRNRPPRESKGAARRAREGAAQATVALTGGSVPLPRPVSFACGESLSLLSATEASSCKYEFIVATPLVCGDARFAPAPSQAASGPAPPGLEPWVLELEQVRAGVATACRRCRHASPSPRARAARGRQRRILPRFARR